MPSTTRAIIIVTGANAGLGFGICQRLLFQLSQSSPFDCLPQSGVDPNYSSASSSKDASSPWSPWNVLTLIMGCRSEKRALDARTKLLALLDEEIQRRKDKDGITSIQAQFMDRFRESLEIDFVPCDLASVDATLSFCDVISNRYPYVTHIICNAGTGSFGGIDWMAAAKQIIKGPIHAVTYPEYKIQHTGVLSQDGIGWVWQCNLFGHYLMVRNLRPLLNLTPTAPARVLWTASLDPLVHTFNPVDPQLLSSPSSYEHSKFETQLVATRLNASVHRKADDDNENGTAITPKIRHFTVHPGVVATGIFKEHLGWLLDLAMVFAFHFARFFGSTDHTISLLNGAHSASHISLAPISSFPPASAPIQYGSKAKASGWLRNGSQSWTGAQDIAGYDAGVADGIIEVCDSLCEEVEGKRGWKARV